MLQKIEKPHSETVQKSLHFALCLPDGTRQIFPGNELVEACLACHRIGGKLYRVHPGCNQFSATSVRVIPLDAEICQRLHSPQPPSKSPRCVPVFGR